MKCVNEGQKFETYSYIQGVMFYMNISKKKKNV